MNAWRGFWESPSPFPAATWDWQSRLFLRSSRYLFPLGKGDTLLDLGCGPGSLAGALITRGLGGYVGLDVSAAALSEARERLQGQARFHFAALGQDYLDFSAARALLSGSPPFPGAPGPFTRLLALSVAQYYRETSELRRLLLAMHALAAPGALILVADLPLRHGGGAFSETWRTLRHAARHRALGRQLLFLGRCAFSPYRRIRKRMGLLTFDQAELEALARELSQLWDAEIQVVADTLTVSLGRVHFWVRLPGGPKRALFSPD